jgi:hypothetical protein
MHQHDFLRRTLSIIAGVYLLFALSFSQHANAHEVGWSYVVLNVEQSGISGNVQLPIAELQQVLALDADGDGTLSEEETNAQWPLIEAYALGVLKLGSDEDTYKLSVIGRDRLIIEVADFAIVRFSAVTPSPVPSRLSIEFTPFFDNNSDHRGGLLIQNNVLTGTIENHTEIAFVFAPHQPSGTINLLGESTMVKVGRFVVEGIWHIWIGIDHVLFIVTLLLTAVMAMRQKRWEPVPDFRKAFINLVTIITLFTVAHSITLALALKGWVTLPSRFVESIIALSVLVVAVNNIWPVLTGKIRWLVFVFGLFHGLGFASVLVDLLITRESKIIALIGFNIGVEAGQLVIVALVFPLLYVIRGSSFYRRILLPGLSAVVALIALWWFVTRALGVESFISSF